MTTQNLHLSRIGLRGTIVSSSGVDDNTKLVLTDTTGKFNPSVFDIEPLLRTLDMHHQESFYCDKITVAENTTDNNLFIYNDFDYTRLYPYLQAQSNANTQKIDFCLRFQLPTLFSSWKPNAIEGYLRVSDQTQVSITAYLIATYLQSIVSKAYITMTKTLINGGPEAQVKFAFSDTDLYPTGPEKYGLINTGWNDLTLRMDLTINTNHWCRYELAKIECKNKLMHPESWE